MQFDTDFHPGTLFLIPTICVGIMECVCDDCASKVDDAEASARWHVSLSVLFWCFHLSGEMSK